MSDIIEGTGKCLCGAARFSAKTISTNVDACHCAMCRNWGGGPLLVVDCGTEVLFDDDNMIAVFNSSEWAERGFCKRCGTHLFYRLKDSNEYSMPVGLFDDDHVFSFNRQIFIDEKSSYYRFANETENMTGAEVFANYAPSAE